MTVDEAEVFIEIIRNREASIEAQAKQVARERDRASDAECQLSLLRKFLQTRYPATVEDFNIWADEMDPNYYGMGRPEKI